jgi:hypothetical protein
MTKLIVLDQKTLSQLSPAHKKAACKLLGDLICVIIVKQTAKFAFLYIF